METKRNYSEIELIVHDQQIEVVYRGRTYASIGVVDETGRLAVAWTRDDFDLIEGYLTTGLRSLDVCITTIDKPMEGAVGLPKYRKREAKPGVEVIQASRKPKTDHRMGGGDSIAEHPRDQVLNAILDSLLDYPDQTTDFTREETKRIAKKHKHGHMQVAGVRANLTRGAYGDPDKLLRDRRRQRRASAASS